MRLWTGFVDYLVLAVLDQPECYYGTPSPREPGNSTETAQGETERHRAGGAVRGQRERRGERKEKAGGEIKKEKEKERFVTLPFTRSSKLIHD